MLHVFNHLAPTLEWLFLFCYAGSLLLHVFNHLAPTLEWLFLFCYAGGLLLHVFNHLTPTLEWLLLFCYAGGLLLHVFNHLAPTLEWLFLFCYAGGFSLHFFLKTATMKFAAEILDFHKKNSDAALQTYTLCLVSMSELWHRCLLHSFFGVNISAMITIEILHALLTLFPIDLVLSVKLQKAYGKYEFIVERFFDSALSQVHKAYVAK